VLQEAYLEFSRALADYLANPSMPFFLWLRMITRSKTVGVAPVGGIKQLKQLVDLLAE
jgi:hypothetical protein